MVSVTTRSLENPFILMIDTTAPEIIVLSDTARFVEQNEELIDSIYISDNVTNVQYSYLYAKGGSVLTSRLTDSLIVIPDTLYLSLPSDQVIADNGIPYLIE